MIWRGLQVEPLAQRLRRYNDWRRGSETIEQPHPKQIGEDIDEAVELLLAMSSAIEATLDKNMQHSYRMRVTAERIVTRRSNHHRENRYGVVYLVFCC